MWNIPLLKLQSGSKPRTFRTHRRHWEMLEYSMDTCHPKKRERRNLQFTFKTSLSSPSSCLAGVKHLFPAKIFIEPLLYAYLLGSWSSLQTLAPLTMQIKTVKRSQENNAKSHRDQALDFSSVHRHFVALSLLFFFFLLYFFLLSNDHIPTHYMFYLFILFILCVSR